MELKVEKREKNLLSVRVYGETYTLLDPLTDVLLRMDGVEFAGYDVPHPLKEEGVLTVRTKDGVSPDKVIIEALNRLKEEFGRIKPDVEQQLKKVG
ncbi:MAG: RpoL/Rpb11 RNA polymerase subunit family protein [Candidatus Methanodesulfokora sp.]|nr:MAG: DNA-directed RNA polymerase subunit L [Candidatus Korarchaeota archaeon]